MDRFERGLRDPQQIPDVAECAECNGEIFRGEHVLEYDGELFHDKECLKEYLIREADPLEVEAV